MDFSRVGVLDSKLSDKLVVSVRTLRWRTHCTPLVGIKSFVYLIVFAPFVVAVIRHLQIMSSGVQSLSSCMVSGPHSQLSCDRYSDMVSKLTIDARIDVY